MAPLDRLARTPLVAVGCLRRHEIPGLVHAGGVEPERELAGVLPGPHDETPEQHRKACLPVPGADEHQPVRVRASNRRKRGLGNRLTFERHLEHQHLLDGDARGDAGGRGLHRVPHGDRLDVVHERAPGRGVELEVLVERPLRQDPVDLCRARKA